MNIDKNHALNWVSGDFPAVFLAFVTLAAVGIFLTGLWPKIRFLFRAPKENRFDQPLRRAANVARIALGQQKLLKNKASGWMHAVIFWGFLVLLLRALEFFVIGWFPDLRISFPGGSSMTAVYGVFKDGFVFLVTMAVVYALYRRWIIRPERLTRSFEGTLILLLILGIMVSDTGFDASFIAMNPGVDSGWAPLGSIFATFLPALNQETLSLIHHTAYWTHVTCILVFLTLLPRSKHFHILTSIPNVYFSNVDGRGNQLHRIDFEDEERKNFGVTQIREFTWKNLLDLHTCTECGRCDDFCPALNSGKPLSPKELTVDLRDHLNRELPFLNHPGLKRDESVPQQTLLGGVIQDETLWSCTTCGACEEECPVMIEYVNKVIEMRQGLVMMEDRYPRELAGAFKSLETNSNPWGFGKDARADWAEGLDVPLWDKANPSEYLYFVGCNGSFDKRGQEISRSVVKALQAGGVDFSILGMREGCTGDPARRAGNEYLFDRLASQNAETFKEQSVLKIITHCPHCFNSLKNEYPEFGVRLEVIHHSEMLQDLLKRGKIAAPQKSGEQVVFHDSCYLGRHNKIYAAPREVLADGGTGNLREVENSKERGTCCGAGGARFLLEENTGTRMSHNRIDELMQAEPEIIAVSCPFCVLMLEDGLRTKNLAGQVKVKDIAEILSGEDL